MVGTSLEDWHSAVDLPMFIFCLVSITAWTVENTSELLAKMSLVTYSLTLLSSHVKLDLK